MPVNSEALAVEAQGVSFFVGGRSVLDAVSFGIPQGAYVGIVGPNGAGKSTLLKILLGLLEPHRGDILVFGQHPLDARKKGGIGYVPQYIAQTDIPFPATVEEIVRSGRTSVVGIGKRLNDADRSIIDAAMQTAGVESLKKRQIGALSGGERQKVFIARALVTQPRLMILDEPTTGVDASSREQFYALLKRLNSEQGMTILLVSHDIEVITDEVSFVLALNQKLLCHCSSHEFLSEGTLQRLYGRDVETLHQHTHCH